MNFVSSAEHLKEVNHAYDEELSMWAASRDVRNQLCLLPYHQYNKRSRLSSRDTP